MTLLVVLADRMTRVFYIYVVSRAVALVEKSFEIVWQAGPHKRKLYVISGKVFISK